MVLHCCNDFVIIEEVLVYTLSDKLKRRLKDYFLIPSDVTLKSGPDAI